MRELELDQDSREVVTPSDKSRRINQHAAKLETSESRRYRGLTARMNYLSQDRKDIQFTVKELSRAMSSPDEDDQGKLKRAVRYLKGTPRFVLVYHYQEKPEGLTVWSDTDFAGCQDEKIHVGRISDARRACDQILEYESASHSIVIRRSRVLWVGESSKCSNRNQIIVS